MTFGEKLQNLRNDNKLAQEKIAELMGVSRQAVSKWENNLSYPDTKNLIILSGIFNVSMDELLNLSSNKIGARKVGIRKDCWKDQTGRLRTSVDFEISKEGFFNAR